MKENKSNTCAIYARTSTTTHNQNPELQVIQLREFCARRNFEVVEVYVDQISGLRESRPALDRLISDARQGRFKIVAITELSRIGRSSKHLLCLLEEIEHYGVSLISLRENLDLSSPMGKAIFTILSAIAALERDLISSRITHALATKKKLAEKNGTGWRCGRPSVINDEVTAKVNELRRHGRSLRDIARAAGISKTTVQRILGQVFEPSTNEKKIAIDIAGDLDGANHE